MLKVLTGIVGALLLGGGVGQAGERAATAAKADVDSGRTAKASSVAVAVTNVPGDLDAELRKLMEMDDEAQEEVDQWIKQDQEFTAKGAGAAPEQLRRRIQQRLEPVGKAYEKFIEEHPGYSKARVAYASFLGDTKGEEAAQEQLEKALAMDTNNPAIYNNLAEIYAHIGPDVKKAFEYYAKAIALKPDEPTYYHNLGTVVYLFRKDAKAYYGIDETQVFAKAFELYSNAMRLDPTNFPLASDVAQSYYGVQPLRTDEALKAWTNALHLAHDDVEKEGVYVHFARLKTLAGRYAEAQKHLDTITNAMYAELKSRLQRNLNAREEQAKTNAAKKLEIGN